MTLAPRPGPCAYGPCPTEGSHLSGYSLGPAHVDVETDTVDAGLWLAEFLRPWVDATAFGRGHALVRLTHSDAAADAFDRGQATRGGGLVPCFALDTEVVSLPGWDDGEATVVADEDLGCFYRVCGSCVDVVSRPGARRARLGLMRVVREALTATALARGHLLDIHAAAFEAGNRAVLLAGPKGAGKTTLLCHALATGRTRMIANDRVMVDVGDGCCEVRGVPTIVSVRPETLRFFPQLRRGPLERPLLFHAGERGAQIAGARDGSPAARAARDFSLSPARLAQRQGTASVRSAPLFAIVFPEILNDADTWALDDLSTSEGLSRLTTCLYGVRREGHSATILEDVGSLGAARLDPGTTAGWPAGRVRFFRCRLGPRAYEAGADGWLDALGLDAAGVRFRP